jgi:hypothetical protein
MECSKDYLCIVSIRRNTDKSKRVEFHYSLSFLELIVPKNITCKLSFTSLSSMVVWLSVSTWSLWSSLLGSNCH